MKDTLEILTDLVNKLGINVDDIEIDEGRRRATFRYYEDFMVIYSETMGFGSTPKKADSKRSGVRGELSLHTLGFEYEGLYIVGNTLTHKP